MSSRLGQSRTYVRIRGVVGLLFIGCGIVILVQTLRKTLGHPEAAVTGVILGVALIALGSLRVRAALATRKAG